MEIALPLIALGGMYVISNQKNDDCTKKEIRKITQENFVNMGTRTNLATRQSESHGNYLPNTNIPPQNFPVTNINQLSDTVCDVFGDYTTKATEVYNKLKPVDLSLRNVESVNEYKQLLYNSADEFTINKMQKIKKCNYNWKSCKLL